MRRSWIATLGGAAVSLAVAGCGGGKPSASQVPENPLPPMNKGQAPPIGHDGSAPNTQPKASEGPQKK